MIKEEIKLIRQKINFLYREEKVKSFLADFDPLLESEKYVLPCSKCKQVPIFFKQKGKIVAECRCGNFPLNCKRIEIAVPKFNKSRRSLKVHKYWLIPVFNIPTPEELDPKELKYKLTMLRKYFELKLRLAVLRRKAGLTKTNIKHIQRLKSYILWIQFVQLEVKLFLKRH